MGILGEPWGPSGPPIVLVAEDGRRVTVTTREHGLSWDDGGGVTQLAHVVETAEPDVINVAGRKFRAIPE